MSMQQYCLRWNNHQPNFISVFSCLLNSESLVDVTLAAEGRHLQAHKVVLSACSSYFQSLFTINPCQHPIVILKDVKFADLKVMVDFMYYGEVNVSQEQLPHILKTAEMLKIKGLAEIPVDQSMSKLETNTTDRAELLATDSNWNNENVPAHSLSPSPCPSPPSLRRKRLRKSSTGSGSGSLEKSTEESHPNESNRSSFQVETVIKSDPNYKTDNTSGQKKNSTDSDIHRTSSHDNIENNSKHVPLIPQQDYSTPPSLSESSIEVQRPSTSTSHQPEGGINWNNLVDQATYATAIQYGFPPNHSVKNEEHPTLSHCMLNMGQSPSPAEEAHNQSQAESSSHQFKKKRSVNPQSEENFIKALDAVRFGGIGFCKAARMYGVNNRTLWLEYKKRGYPNFRLSIKNRKTEPQSADENSAQKTDVLPPEPGKVEHQNQYVELQSSNSSNLGGTGAVGYFDKQVDFGQMIQRMNSAAMMDHQQDVPGYQTVNFEHIN